MLDRVGQLRARGRKAQRGEFRASGEDRADAFRRLEAHKSLGHIGEREAATVRKEIEDAETPNEIVEVFVHANLPELPARSPATEGRVSDQDRRSAIARLEMAQREGRLTPEECAAATNRVYAARTRNEIDAAFHGLPSPSRAARAEAASTVAGQGAALGSRMVKEGGRRAGKVFRRGVLSIGALLLGFIFLIAGMGMVALVCFVVAVLLFVSAAISLVTAKR